MLKWKVLQFAMAGAWLLVGGCHRAAGPIEGAELRQMLSSDASETSRRELLMRWIHTGDSEARIVELLGQSNDEDGFGANWKDLNYNDFRLRITLNTERRVHSFAFVRATRNE